MALLVNFFHSIVTVFIEMAPFMLLGLIVAGVLHVGVPDSLLVKHTGQKGFASIIKASLIGVPLPLCSCGVVPAAAAMAKKGASKGAVVSFLTSTPQTGIDSIVATYGMLGPLFALFRPFAALISGVVSGVVVEHAVQDYPETDGNENHEYHEGGCCCPDKKESRMKIFFKFSFVEFIDDIGLELVIGIIISGLITVIMPADLPVKLGISHGIPAMLLMGLGGIPMYVCATASIPIGLSFMMKGFSPGAVFVFLAVGPLTNAATIGMVAKVIGKKATALYILTTFVISLIFGVLLDLIVSRFGNSFAFGTQMLVEQEHAGFVSIVAAVILLIMLLGVFYRKIIRKRQCSCCSC